MRVGLVVAFLLTADACRSPSPTRSAARDGQESAAAGQGGGPPGGPRGIERETKLDPPSRSPGDGSSILVAHEDGSYTIAGVRAELERLLAGGDAAHEIAVRGWVYRMDEAPACAPASTCSRVVWITDDPGEPKAGAEMMLVVDSFPIAKRDIKRWRDQPKVQLEVGKQYTFKVTVARRTDSGITAEDGLLRFMAYRPVQQDEAWIHPPGAPWHPLEIERAAMQDAMKNKP